MSSLGGRGGRAIFCLRFCGAGISCPVPFCTGCSALLGRGGTTLEEGTPGKGLSFIFLTDAVWPLTLGGRLSPSEVGVGLEVGVALGLSHVVTLECGL